MTVELLYPELSCLYGDPANARYLAACIRGARLVATEGSAAPAFSRGEADVVVIGSMTERNQNFALDRLRPHAGALKDGIERDLTVIATGNALDLFGQSIDADGETIPCLGVFDTFAVRRMNERHNGFFLGEYEGMKIVGHKAQFSMTHGAEKYPFITAVGGFGCHTGTKAEGIRYKRFYGTYLLGPFLLLNPPFVQYLLRSLGQPDTLLYEEAITQAYRRRLEELSRDGFDFSMGWE